MTAAEATAIAGLGAAAAGGDSSRLRRALDGASDLVPVAHVEEYLLQTYLFAGFPRAINAFFTWQSWAADRDIGRAPEPAEPDQPAEWRKRGVRLCRLVYGENYEALQRRMARLHPALAEWTLVEGYGKVLSRRGPDAARRELAAVGALIALGAERQLAAHLKGALNAGVGRRVLREAARAVANVWGQAPLVQRLLEGAVGG